MEEVICSNEKQTATLARRVGQNAVAGDIICLKGELGAGKTHFVKGFVEAFDISPEAVSSPTFSIINEYHGRLTIYHFDCYRLSDPRDAVEIGAEEYFYGDGVCIIEWPERIDSILPGDVKWIEINTINSTTRQFRLY